MIRHTPAQATNPRFYRASAAVATLLALLAFAPTAALAQNACAIAPPQRKLEGVRWYSDQASSIVDTEKQKQNDAAMKPVRDLLRIVADAADHGLDSQTPGDAACALANLSAWSAADALLARPTWSVPLAELTIATVGLNLAALKFRDAGQPLPKPIIDWIGKVTKNIVETYEENKVRSNLYTWSGAAAASNDLLTGERRYSAYVTGVWRESIAKIRPDGYVADELSRKGRALIYHNYLRGALVLLSRLRFQLGDASTPEELSSLAQLDHVVNLNVCDSTAIGTLANSPQEAMGRWEASIGTYFAQAGKNSSWQRCVRTPKGFSGPTYGGRFDLTDRMLSQPARR